MVFVHVEHRIYYSDDDSADSLHSSYNDKQLDETDDSYIRILDCTANPPSWQPDYTLPRVKPVTKNEGYLVPIPDKALPITFFKLLVYIVFLKNILSIISIGMLWNYFAVGNTKTLSSRIHRWSDIPYDNMRVFLDSC